MSGTEEAFICLFVGMMNSERNLRSGSSPSESLKLVMAVRTNAARVRVAVVGIRISSAAGNVVVVAIGEFSSGDYKLN